ncbi:YesL family protein [Oceanobacillus longus]|uniref:YesL family protein n=1 Tax=Oceanobacillus longus TaxID=930120 RepID=A0ABV8GZK0_9BACI
MDTVTSGIFAGFDWFIRIVKLNVLWVLASVAGLFLFSVFPATSAAFTVTNEWTKGNKDVPVWNTFKTAFQNNFWKSQAMGYLLGVTFFILFIDIRLFLSFESHLMWNVLIITLSIFLFLLFVVSFYGFPMIIELEGSVKEIMKAAFFRGFSYMHWTFINILGVVAIGLVTFIYPVAFLFLSGAVTFLWITCMNQIVKAKIETKYESLQRIAE